MAWKVYETVFQLKSPLHIGAQRVGMIQRTRHYIPAMTFWGALTSRLTRLLFQSPKPDDYKAVGNFCNTRLLTSYFFPLIIDSSNSDILMPGREEAGVWMYGGMHQSEFERVFLTGYGSTAIDPKYTAAQKASLHEVQFLMPRVRYDDNIVPVYFQGYLFVQEEAPSETDKSFRLVAESDDIKLTVVSDGEKRTVSISQLLEFLQVGGERTYGYGRLALLPKRFCQTTGDLWSIYAVETSEKYPGLKITAKCATQAIPAHLQIAQAEKYSIEGVVEPIVSRQWGKSNGGNGRGAGEHLAYMGTCFVPGSALKTGEMRVSVGPYGILKTI